MLPQQKLNTAIPLLPVVKIKVMMRNIPIIAAMLAVFSTSEFALAHGGGLNSDGCHRQSSTGTYHCHNTAVGREASAAAPRLPRRTSQSFVGSSGGGAYANCTQARAAGAAPVLAGESGYSRHLDRDNDGIACE